MLALIIRIIFFYLLFRFLFNGLILLNRYLSSVHGPSHAAKSDTDTAGKKKSPFKDKQIIDAEYEDIDEK